MPLNHSIPNLFNQNSIDLSRVFKQRRARYLHESGLAIVYGLGVGVVLRLMGTNREVRTMGKNGWEKLYLFKL